MIALPKSSNLNAPIVNRFSESIDIPTARRLALLCAGLLKPEWSAFPQASAGNARCARQDAQRVIARFGYLQLDTVSIAGARSHTIVLLSRLEPFDPQQAEELLQPGEPLFEYWGHEVSWIPIELYPLFDFRRRAFCHHPWWGDLVGQYPQVAADLRRRIRDQGPLRSMDMEGRGGRGWWDLKVAKRVASALWSSGELAIRERRNFQRIYDLSERVIDERWRRNGIPEAEAIEKLLLLALQGHGWATTSTLSQTWRFHHPQTEIQAALIRLAEKGEVTHCVLQGEGGKRIPGWIQPCNLDLADRLRRMRPRSDRGVLLSPFDPLLWDRGRVRLLFDFEQVLEIFKPAGKRRYGYYCLPVLAGERLVARVDLKADRRKGILQVLSQHFEESSRTRLSAIDRQATRRALERYAQALKFNLR